MVNNIKKNVLTTAIATAFVFGLHQTHAAWSIDSATPWPNGEIPYVLDQSVLDSPVVLQRFFNALDEYESRTVVRFVERNAVNAANYPNYKRIVFDANGVGSDAGSIGMIVGETLISLGGAVDDQPASDGSIWGLRVILHELGHVLGFPHEAARGDIWQAYSIDWALVTSAEPCVFPDRQVLASAILLTQYDYHSIMGGAAPACGTNAFGGPSRDYAVPIFTNIEQPSVVHELSKLDVEGVNALYTSEPIPKMSDALTVAITTATWTGGYCAYFDITNNTAETVEDWTLEFSAGSITLDSFWSSNMLYNGSAITATGLTWNQNLAPQEMTNIGYCATGELPADGIKIQ